MIDDSSPHCIFKIDELTRLIASHLVLIGPGSAVDLACTCRYLESPVLSTLWKTQSSLHTLLKTLPRDTWNWNGHALTGGVVRDIFTVVGTPSPEAWNRVQGYASWMRFVRMGERQDLGEGTPSKLRLNAPPGGWFPALQGLNWSITISNYPYLDLFFSQNLRAVTISTHWDEPKFPRSSLPVIASTISALPATTLQSLSMSVCDHGAPPTYLTDSLSSVVLRCGPSLRDFTSLIPLSDEAISHLIHLPHLRTWHTVNSPPSYSTSPLPLTFPPLKGFALLEGVAPGWLSLFKHLGNGISSTQGTAPLSGVRGSLESLNIKHFPDPIIDPSFTSAIQIFQNLVHLSIMVVCSDGQCAFKLNNDNVVELSMALPRLNHLLLGYPCGENTCATTVACLLPISVHCPGLQFLGIHFNTTNIVDDLKNISEDPQFQELRSFRRCDLSRLYVYRVPLTPDKSGLKTVARVMMDIFPNLEHCDGWGGLKLKRKMVG